MKIFFTGVILAICAFGFVGVAQAETFKTNLTTGSTGSEVVELQTWLEATGYLVIPAGNSKGYFGPLTLSALIKYQTSQNIAPAVGYFGPITRAKINQTLAVAAGNDQCAALSNMHFLALTKDEMGLGQDGAVLGYWSISFNPNRFTWNYSDVSERGSYSCQNNVVHLEFPDRKSEKSYVAYYDPEKKILELLGKDYGWAVVPHQ